MIFYNIIFAPIEYIVKFVFLFFYKKFDFLGVGGAIFGVSIVINFLALPLYNIADAIQDKHRQTEKKLNDRVKKIKKAFKGDEQFMMLQTYYKQNNYHPLYVLKSSLSILIEIPFFIAAFHYLSNCTELQNQSFLFLSNLGSPDHLLFGINILPILMTLINVVSTAIYTHGTTIREKIQTYLLAAVFLILLYNSPSGLVCYWILNNIFSLIKNIVVKMKNPAKITYFILTVICIILTIGYFCIKRDGSTRNKLIVLSFTILVLLIPVFYKILVKLFAKSAKYFTLTKQNTTIFIFSAISCALLFGVFLPASVIGSSPIEFSFMGKTDNPIYYLLNSASLFLGLFIFWPICIYKLFDKNVKKFLPIIFFALLTCSILNIFIFKSDYGRLNSLLILDVSSNLLKLSWILSILPIFSLLLLCTIYFLLQHYNKQHIILITTICLTFAIFASSIPKIYTIKTTYNRYKINIASKSNTNEIKPFFHLSKTNKNVIVLFLDRAINSYFPKILQEFPEIEPQFDGFTYYPNTLSFGTGTLSGSPAMMGGYEYTPINMNNRKDELLVTKHNEATLVMPKLFLDANYEVAVSDVPFPNYQWRGDLSAFKPYPQIHVTEFKDQFNYTFAKEKNIKIKDNPDLVCKNNMPYFCLMQGLYPVFRNTFYSVTIGDTPFESGYLSQYASLYYLSNLTDFSSQQNTFSFICNETPHEFTFLDTNYECPLTLKNPDSTDYMTMSYQVNIAALKQVGKFLEYLKNNNCYNNTRIIIVADHGFDLPLEKTKDFADFSFNPISINPLLLVKDFNCVGAIKTDNSLMTNADTVLLAIDNLEISKTNPFTKKSLVSQKDNNTVTFYDAEISNNEKVYQYKINQSRCYTIKNNIFDINNWTTIEAK